MKTELLEYLTPQELDALSDTNKWLQKDSSRFKKVMGMTRKPIEFAYNKVPESVRESIASAILGVLTSVRDGTTNLVSPGAVIGKIKERHGPIGSKADHFRVGVENLDSLAREYVKKSKTACTAEGAVTGVVGLPGIVADIPALYSLLFRMIAQVSTCYGFQVDAEDERTHMLKILDIGHQLEAEAKKAGMEELDQIQEMIRENVPVVDVQRFAIQKGLQTMARHLGLALTQRKLAQSVVLIGGIVGAGVNRQLAGEVGEIAFHAYRRRHLAELAAMRQEGVISSPFKPKKSPAASKLPKPPSYS